MDPVDDAVLSALWGKVLERFDDDAPHAAFIEHARRSGSLAEAARRYRAHRESLTADADEPSRRQIDRRLAAIALLAMSELRADDTAVDQAARLRRWLALIMLGLLLLTLFALFRALLL